VGVPYTSFHFDVKLEPCFVPCGESTSPKALLQDEINAFHTCLESSEQFLCRWNPGSGHFVSED